MTFKFYVSMLDGLRIMRKEMKRGILLQKKMVALLQLLQITGISVFVEHDYIQLSITATLMNKMVNQNQFIHSQAKYIAFVFQQKSSWYVDMEELYGREIQADTVKLRAVKCDIKIMLVPYEGAILPNSGKVSRFTRAHIHLLTPIAKAWGGYWENQ